MEKVDRITVDRCNNMVARVNECKRHWQGSCSRCRYFGYDCLGTFDLLHHIEMDYKVMIRQLIGLLIGLVMGLFMSREEDE